MQPEDGDDSASVAHMCDVKHTEYFNYLKHWLPGNLQSIFSFPPDESTFMIRKKVFFSSKYIFYCKYMHFIIKLKKEMGFNSIVWCSIILYSIV